MMIDSTVSTAALQCARLVEEFGIVHLSAGDLLRAHMKSGSQEGNMVAQMIKDGQIVPSHVTISLLQKAMADSAQDKFLIDGFPRNDENRNAFEQQVCNRLTPTWPCAASSCTAVCFMSAMHICSFPIYNGVDGGLHC